MRRVRRVVHGPAAGLTAPQKDDRPTRRPSIRLRPGPSSFPYSPECVEWVIDKVGIDLVIVTDQTRKAPTSVCLVSTCC